MVGQGLLFHCAKKPTPSHSLISTKKFGRYTKTPIEDSERETKADGLWSGVKCGEMTAYNCNSNPIFLPEDVGEGPWQMKKGTDNPRKDN